MTRPARFIPIFIAVLCSVAGCATSRQWSVSDSEKAEGLVRVSYEFPEAHEPSLSENDARQLALHRCEGWGYDDAEPIAGQLRQCSNMDDGSCNLWTVTREFQCTRDDARSAGNQRVDGHGRGERGAAQANIAAR
jgi:hypothetical protein